MPACPKCSQELPPERSLDLCPRCAISFALFEDALPVAAPDDPSPPGAKGAILRSVQTLRSLLTHRSVALWVAAIGVALTLPSLGAGLYLDDYVLWATASGAPALRDLFPRPLDMFAFIDGDPERTRQMMDRGILPWCPDLAGSAFAATRLSPGVSGRCRPIPDQPASR